MKICEHIRALPHELENIILQYNAELYHRKIFKATLDIVLQIYTYSEPMEFRIDTWHMLPPQIIKYFKNWQTFTVGDTTMKFSDGTAYKLFETRGLTFNRRGDILSEFM
jgi:hypothetical protein